MRALLLVAALAACGGDDAANTVVVVCPDAGDAAPVPIIDAAAPPPMVDAGPPLPTVDASAADLSRPANAKTILKKIVDAPSVTFLGLTAGDSPFVVYLDTHASTNLSDLVVLPLAGGTPTVLTTGLTSGNGGAAILSGGAVAWYAFSDGLRIADTVNFWTPAAGSKSVKTNTVVGLFWASDDGARVAFSANATQDSTDIAVTSASAPDATKPALAGTAAVNLNADPQDCPQKIEFRQSVFIGAYCTGVAANATQPLLVTVGADGKAVLRLDDAMPANDFDGTWDSDESGTKLAVNDVVAGGRLIDATTATTVIGPLGNVGAGIVLPDGSGYAFVTGNKLAKATFANPPVTTSLVASGVAQLVGSTSDSKTVLFARTVASGLSDLYAVDVTAATPTPVTVLATTKNVFLSLSGDEKNVIYIDGAQADEPKLASVALTGGTPVVLQAPLNRLGGGLDVEAAREGTGLLFTIGSNPVPATALERSTLGYVDAVKGGGLEAATTLLRTTNERGVWSGKTYVFRDLGDNPGIYTLTVP